MNKINDTFTSYTGRMLIYVSVFILGAAIHELCLQLLHPALRTSGALINIIILVAFISTGALLARKGSILSRIASISTLLVLGLIALRIGHASISDSYLLVITLSIAAAGAHPSLHRDTTSAKRVALYGIFTFFVGLAVAFVFSYGMLILDRIALQ